MSSARGGQFILSNTASWSISSAVFLLIKPRQTSLSSIRRQRRTWTWIRYDESVQDTSRKKKYGNKASAKRHLWKNCWTERHANPAELICKTIEYVITTLRNKREGVQTGAFSPTDSVKNNIICWRQTTESGLTDHKGRLSTTKDDATLIRPS